VATKRKRNGRGSAQDRIDEALRSGAESLSLGRMGLTALPESIGQLTQLKELKLASNKLMALHEAIVSSPSSPAS
jgi:Leucine-rich repeat (LRR) protein